MTEENRPLSQEEIMRVVADAQAASTSQDLSAASLIKLMVAKSRQTHEKIITIEGHEFKIRYRQLGYLGIAKCVAEARRYMYEKDTETGEERPVVIFRDDLYKLSALREMIVESPIPFTQEILSAADETFGAQLDDIIPSPGAALAQQTEEKKELDD